MTKSFDPAVSESHGWSLTEAKDRLEEIVRAAEEGEVQYVEVDGRRAVVLLAVEEFQRLVEPRTGQALVDAMQRCPYPDFEIAPSVFSPVRDVEL